MTEGREAGATDRLDEAIDRVVHAWTAGEPSPALRTRVLARLGSAALDRPSAGWAWPPIRLAAGACVVLAAALLAWLVAHPAREPALPSDARVSSAPPSVAVPERSAVAGTPVRKALVHPPLAAGQPDVARAPGAAGTRPTGGPAGAPYAETLALDRLPRLVEVDLEPLAVERLHVSSVDIEPIVIVPLDAERPGRGGSRRP